MKVFDRYLSMMASNMESDDWLSFLQSFVKQFKFLVTHFILEVFGGFTTTDFITIHKPCGHNEKDGGAVRKDGTKDNESEKEDGDGYTPPEVVVFELIWLFFSEE